ncbi:MAG TPA: hypothetical protein VFB81_01270 [Myxococcales bacterium]|nr:hypothetical protein [Myxococcales bacterium]
MTQTASLNPDEIVVAVHGRFDVQAVWRVCQQIAHTGPVSRLVVDFSRAVQVLDDALATFADRAPRLREHLRVRGLSRHHHKVLAYLGLRLHDEPVVFAAD